MQPIEKPSDMLIEGSVSASRPLPARVADAFDDGLTERQRTFVDFYCSGVPKEIAGSEEDIPAGKGCDAAKAAGYAESGAFAMASRNLLNPKVQDEIERRVKAGRGSALLVATTALFRQVEHGSDERAVVTAAMALLDRFGMAPPRGPLIDARTVNNNISGPEASAVLQMIADRAAQRQLR